MGTELDRRGVGTELPLWSAGALLHAPEIVAAVHADYVAAGAEIVTTNTFRTHARSLAKAEMGSCAPALTTLATRLAREAAAAAPRPCWVAGSMSPLEDCFSPDLTPDPDVLATEHALMAGQLAAAGADILLVETMPTVVEARAATAAALATGLPVLTGFACDGRGRLVSGESVAAAARAVAALGPDALMINCTPTAALSASLMALRAATTLPLGAYGNVGHADTTSGWAAGKAIGPEDYAHHARHWISLGVSVVGSCCGTTPEHTRALATALRGGAGAANADG
jgi:homocysteine S-methyltransferase